MSCSTFCRAASTSCTGTKPIITRREVSRLKSLSTGLSIRQKRGEEFREKASWLGKQVEQVTLEQPSSDIERGDLEVAGMVQLLVSECDEVLQMKAREMGSPMGENGKEGSLELTYEKMQELHDLMKTEAVNRFDDAVEVQDLAKMREQALLMEKLQDEDTLVHRYISQRPMFTEISEVQLESEDFEFFDPKHAEDMLLKLTKSYRQLVNTVQNDAKILKQVFTQSVKAVETLISRILEQKVQIMLAGCMLNCKHDSKVEVVEQYLNYMVDVYKHTMRMAQSLNEVSNVEMDVQDLANQLFNGYLLDFDKLQINFLQEIFGKERRGGNEGRAEEQIEWDDIRGYCVRNKEATERLVALKLVSIQSIQQIFSGESYGCLLTQVGDSLFSKILGSADVCLSQFSNLSTVLVDLANNPSYSAVRPACKQLPAIASLAHLLQQIQKSEQGLQQVNSYTKQYLYTTILQIGGSSSNMALSQFQQSVSELILAIEEAVSAVVREIIDLISNQLQKSLKILQRPLDFVGDEATETFSMDSPTNACIVLCAFLTEIFECAGKLIAGIGLRSFIEDLSEELYNIVKLHMIHFQYSPMGTLKWRRDLDEYRALVGKYKVPNVELMFSRLQDHSSIMMVTPDSLLPLVDTTLRLNHKEAFEFVKLRTDFRSARIKGQPLQKLLQHV
eukprot:TRINITY_DN1593_c0_g1_i3.p1 TRINITY_DN1593_c0_g1~~TRINITY_DN1593_c0_g1_i3.p1  ORF type:complete len:675 (-),score=149.44 TRINITY_DN1593_c0_g1_i3:377-2401(-)